MQKRVIEGSGYSWQTKGEQIFSKLPTTASTFIVQVDGDECYKKDITAGGARVWGIPIRLCHWSSI